MALTTTTELLVGLQPSSRLGTGPGAARRQLKQLTPEQHEALLAEVAEAFGDKPEDYGDGYPAAHS